MTDIQDSFERLADLEKMMLYQDLTSIRNAYETLEAELDKQREALDDCVKEVKRYLCNMKTDEQLAGIERVEKLLQRVKALTSGDKG